MERRAVNRDLFQFRLLDSPQLGPDTPLAMGVPAVIANQVLALLRNMLRQFGQEVERAEDLEVANPSSGNAQFRSVCLTCRPTRSLAPTATKEDKRTIGTARDI